VAGSEDLRLRKAQELGWRSSLFKKGRPKVAPLLTRQEANKKRLSAALVGTVLVVLGFPFFYWWAGSAPASDWLDFCIGGALVGAGGLLLGAAGVNRLGINWWANVTEEDDPLRPI
jgi:hypothetical protein